MGLQATDNNVPERVINVYGATIMWDIPVITDRTIPVNRPDVALHDKKENTCLLIDIAIPSYSNIDTKETIKLRKYKDLDIEVSRMREVRTEIVPVIIGVLGAIRK
jgi:hypothetical protein